MPNGRFGRFGSRFASFESAKKQVNFGRVEQHAISPLPSASILPFCAPECATLSANPMSGIERIIVRAPSASYSVLFGRGLLGRVGELIAKQDPRLANNTGVYVLSAPRVWKHWGRELERSFRGRGKSKTILFDDREISKSMVTVAHLCRRLAQEGADRRAVIVAMGGGVVGDVAGFVAASYLRGVPLVHVPTTLVAQVDSAIGGKTGVNLPEGKNLVGAFYQPGLVLCDPDALGTLPARHYRAGLYEVIKYGVIGDKALFRWLEADLDKLLRRDPSMLSWTLRRCVRAKAEVVRRDEREYGVREILNFGHTVGHALEHVTRYRKFLHGEAVAWGMMAATWIAAGTGLLDASAAARILQLVSRVGPLSAWPNVSAARLVEAMRTDKKARGGRLRFVLPRKIGGVKVVGDVPDALLKNALSEMVRRVRQTP